MNQPRPKLRLGAIELPENNKIQDHLGRVTSAAQDLSQVMEGASKVLAGFHTKIASQGFAEVSTPSRVPREQGFCTLYFQRDFAVPFVCFLFCFLGF